MDEQVLSSAQFRASSSQNIKDGRKSALCLQCSFLKLDSCEALIAQQLPRSFFGQGPLLFQVRKQISRVIKQHLDCDSPLGILADSPLGILLLTDRPLRLFLPSRSGALLRPLDGETLSQPPKLVEGDTAPVSGTQPNGHGTQERLWRLVVILRLGKRRNLLTVQPQIPVDIVPPEDGQLLHLSSLSRQTTRGARFDSPERALTVVETAPASNQLLNEQCQLLLCI
mmetsp:Transcript_1057/g.2982  ORF Transcript_1057/g.2982 Transcript_1057/m.2982 type:complete len:226 (+) Transcript_1057:324-1001(+)